MGNSETIWIEYYVELPSLDPKLYESKAILIWTLTANQPENDLKLRLVQSKLTDPSITRIHSKMVEIVSESDKTKSNWYKPFLNLNRFKIDHNRNRIKPKKINERTHFNSKQPGPT